MCRNTTLFVLMASLMMVVNATNLQLILEPDTVDDSNHQDLHLSCQPSDLKTFDQILMLRLFKEGKTMAAVYKDIATNDSSQQAHGHIGETAELTYLNVTMLRQDSKAVGQYKCSMDYLDEFGRMSTKTATADVKERKPDIRELEKIVEQLEEKVGRLEKDKNNLNKQVMIDQLEVSDLKDKLMHQEMIWNKKVSYLQDSLQMEDSNAEGNITALITLLDKHKKYFENKMGGLQKLLEKEKNSVNENIIILQNKLDKQLHDQETNHNNKITNIIQELQNERKVIQQHGKNEEDFEGRIKTLDKAKAELENKINDMEENELRVQLMLNETKKEITDELSNLVTSDVLKQFDYKLSNRVKATSDKIDHVSKNLIEMDYNTRKILIDKLSGFATKSEVKKLSEKESVDFAAMQASYNILVTQENARHMKIDNETKSLKLSQDGIANSIKHVASDLKSTKTYTNDEFSKIKKVKKYLLKTIQDLSIAGKGYAARLDNLGNLNASYIKSYVDTAVAQYKMDDSNNNPHEEQHSTYHGDSSYEYNRYRGHYHRNEGGYSRHR